MLCFFSVILMLLKSNTTYLFKGEKPDNIPNLLLILAGFITIIILFLLKSFIIAEKVFQAQKVQSCPRPYTPNIRYYLT